MNDNDDIEFKITRTTTKTIELSFDQIEKILKKYFLDLDPDETAEFIWGTRAYSSPSLIIKIEEE